MVRSGWKSRLPNNRKYEADQQEHIQEIIAGRNRLFSLYPEELDADAVTDRRKHTGDHQVLELCFSGKYPHAGVHPEQIQDQNRDAAAGNRKAISDGKKIYEFIKTNCT